MEISIIEDLDDYTLKARKKEELNTLNKKMQKEFESRDFKIKIDDLYRIAYGIGPDTSQDVVVVTLRNEIKKDV